MTMKPDSWFKIMRDGWLRFAKLEDEKTNDSTID